MRQSIRYLWILVIILLILNLTLLYGLNLARLTVIQTLNKVETTLSSVANEVIVYNIEVNQAVPIKADIPLNQTMDIPINTVVPIDQVLTVPFQMGNSEIELDMPLTADFPIDTVVPVDFNETIRVDTVVQLNTTIPVEIDIAQTPLAGYLGEARLEVAQLRSYLTLQGRAVAAEETGDETIPHRETNVGSAPTPASNPQSEAASVEMPATTTPSSEVTLKSDSLNASQSMPADPASSTDNAVPQPDLGWCDHVYWPLRSDTTWTYNNSNTSYSQRVDNVSNNQVHLSTQYEGRDIQFNLLCYQEGLGGGYLGDMRRMTELGNLNFNNPHGIFLPRPEVMEDIGKPWTQEYDVTGTIEAHQGDRPVIGNISRGRAVAVYTPTGFETLETPLGPREALRIEQKLDLELDIDFDLNSQTIPATEVVKLTNVYWFVKGIGPVKIHWQGGAIQQGFKIGDIPTNQQSSVPPLTEEQLVFVCVSLKGESSECMRITGVSQSDLTTPPESELEMQGFVFPDDVGGDDSVSSTTGTVDPIKAVESPAVADESSEEPPETSNNGERSTLLAYAEAVANLGEKTAEAAEGFGKAAIAYRNGEITLAEFQNKFSSFSPKVKGVVQEINGLSPPPEAATLHQKLTSGLGQCDEAIDLMDDWFDTHDSGTKEAAALLVASCIDQVETAGDELEALVNGN